MRKVLGCLLGGAVALTTPVFAHHSAVIFDDTKEITVTGTVKEFQYTNPHSWLLVDVKNDDGTITTWGFEAEGPSTLTRAGAWIKATRGDGTDFDPRAGFAIR